MEIELSSFRNEIGFENILVGETFRHGGCVFLKTSTASAYNSIQIYPQNTSSTGAYQCTFDAGVLVELVKSKLQIYYEKVHAEGIG